MRVQNVGAIVLVLTACCAGDERVVYPVPTGARVQAGKHATPTGSDCRASYAPRPDRDPTPMCRVLGGLFWMGVPRLEKPIPRHQDPLGRARPRHRVRVSTFYIDQFEVTNGQYVKFLNATGGHKQCAGAPYGGRCVKLLSGKAGVPDPILLEHGTYTAAKGQENLPVWSASYQGADRYCRWAGKVLPTDAQWEYAARHEPSTGQDYQYPWGNTFDHKRANYTGRSIEVGRFDGSGARGDGRSPWGVHDMGGNASEIVGGCGVFYDDPRWCAAKQDGVCVDPYVPYRPGCDHGVRGSPHGRPEESVSAWRSITGAGGGFRCARPAE